MKKNDIGIIGLILSILGFLYSVFMNISYDGVVNLSLMSQRQTFLILSGFIFIGSLILIKDINKEHFYEEKPEQKEETPVVLNDGDNDGDNDGGNFSIIALSLPVAIGIFYCIIKYM
jgi:hypothetical protein